MARYRETLCVSCGRIELRGAHGRGASFCWDCSTQHSSEGLRAIRRLQYAVKTGKLPRAKGQTCVDCGAPATDYDHRDYTKPLDVEPVCRSCNTKRGPALDSQMRAVLPVTADQDMAVA